MPILREPTAWDEIRRLVDVGDADGLVDRLITLAADERKVVAAEVRGHLPVLRARSESTEEWPEPVEEGEPERWPELVRLVGAATFGTVAAVASWVTRRDLLTSEPYTERAEFGDPARMVRLLGHRPAAWQHELAVRLAAKVRDATDPGVPLALAVLRHTGVEPPRHDPLVAAWVSTLDAAVSDPLLPVLLPRIFEAEGVGRVLERARAPWLRILRRHGDREQLLDGCVRRFLRGGTAHDLRFFVHLHEELAPSTAEAAARRRDYLRLLPAAPGQVAELALRHLHRLDAHDPADVAEAVEGLMFRAEVKLVRAGLTWLDRTVRETPAQADALAPALATAFGHVSYEVQGRAAQLALKHREHFTPRGIARVGAAVPDLPPALGARLTAAFAPTPPGPAAQPLVSGG